MDNTEKDKQREDNNEREKERLGIVTVRKMILIIPFLYLTKDELF